ncbi:MAG TPA: hypothetical protein VJ890_20455 [Vineibacter sp.]|nr:hypothetical protein [Vineibacter sp.]
MAVPLKNLRSDSWQVIERNLDRSLHVSPATLAAALRRTIAGDQPPPSDRVLAAIADALDGKVKRGRRRQLFNYSTAVLRREVDRMAARLKANGERAYRRKALEHVARQHADTTGEVRVHSVAALEKRLRRARKSGH